MARIPILIQFSMLQLTILSILQPSSMFVPQKGLFVFFITFISLSLQLLLLLLNSREDYFISYHILSFPLYLTLPLIIWFSFSIHPLIANSLILSNSNRIKWVVLSPLTHTLHKCVLMSLNREPDAYAHPCKLIPSTTCTNDSVRRLL